MLAASFRAFSRKLTDGGPIDPLSSSKIAVEVKLEKAVFNQITDRNPDKINKLLGMKFSRRGGL